MVVTVILGAAEDPQLVCAPQSATVVVECARHVRQPQPLAVVKIDVPETIQYTALINDAFVVVNRGATATTNEEMFASADKSVDQPQRVLNACG